jgi:hypothetical protein
MAYRTCPRWVWWWGIWWNEDWQGKPKYLEKTWRSANLSTTNPTPPDPGSNPGRRSGKPATNRLSYGAALLPWNTRLCPNYTVLQLRWLYSSHPLLWEHQIQQDLIKLTSFWMCLLICVLRQWFHYYGVIEIIADGYQTTVCYRTHIPTDIHIIENRKGKWLDNQQNH